MDIKIRNIRTTGYPAYVLLTVIVFICLTSTYSILRHYCFISTAFDLGVFMQKIWLGANGIKSLGWTAFFGHAHPILLLLLPIYKLLPYAETLLIIQAVSVGLSGLIFYRFANYILKDEDLSLGLMLLYLLNPYLLGLIRFDFHPVSLAPPFIILTAYYLEKEEYKKAFISSMFVLSVKEDAGLVLIGLGGYYLLKINKFRLKHVLRKILRFNLERKEINLICMGLLGIVWMFVAIFVLIPHYSGRYGFISQRYSATSILSFLSHKIICILLNGIFTAFIPYFYPPNILLFGLPMLENLLSSRPFQIVIGYHYQYMVVPLLFVSMVYSIKFRNIAHTRAKKLIAGALLISIVFSPLFPPMPFDEYYPIRINEHYKVPIIMRDYVTFPNEHHRILLNITRTLNSCNLSILAQNEIFPHLANRENIHLFLDSKNPPELAIFDKKLLYYCVPKDATWCIRLPYSNLTKLYIKVYERDGIEIYILKNETKNKNIKECLELLQR